MTLRYRNVKPILLHPDNIPPASRTPWGGTTLIEQFGKNPPHGSRIVGESWEVSVEPSFPSRNIDTGEDLRNIIQRAPQKWLGEDVGTRYDIPHLLTKLLDANDNLSLQVHPHVIAAPGETHSGKHETWIILAAEPGAGIYLGFKPGTDPEALVDQIKAQTNIAEQMNFVDVQPGDAFHIRPGTPHAIGKGITLFEPQAVQPNCKGVTYRCWDWNRLYDAEGNRSTDGEPRDLHLQRFLEVTAWDRVNTPDFVDSCREEPTRFEQGEMQVTQVHDAHWYFIERIEGCGERHSSTRDRLVAITCIGGHIDIRTSADTLRLTAGQSAVIPAAAEDFTILAQDADAFITWDTPENAHHTSSRSHPG